MRVRCTRGACIGVILLTYPPIRWSSACVSKLQKVLLLHIPHCVPLLFHPCLFHGFLWSSLSPTPDRMVIGCLPPSSLPPSVANTPASGNQGTKE